MTTTAPPVAPPDEAPAPPRAPLALLRNTWRGLTSMRTALVLLFLLALAALPGALLPQRSLNQRLVTQYFAEHPTLAGVVAVAAGTGGGSLRGVVLTLAYCAGLGLPFVAIALGASRAVGALGWLRRHTRAIQVGGGVLLVAVGLLLVTGLWGGLLARLQVSVAGFTPVL